MDLCHLYPKEVFFTNKLMGYFVGFERTQHVSMVASLMLI